MEIFCDRVINWNKIIHRFIKNEWNHKLQPSKHVQCVWPLIASLWGLIQTKSDLSVTKTVLPFECRYLCCGDVNRLKKQIKKQNTCPSDLCGPFWDAAVETKQLILISTPNRTKIERFKNSSAFPLWICQWSGGIKMLSPWETPLKFSLYVIYTENKAWAKNHRECLFKHNSHCPWKMIKACSLTVNVHIFRISSFKIELLHLMLSCQYNQICFLTNHCGINLCQDKEEKQFMEKRSTGSAQIWVTACLMCSGKRAHLK